MNEVEYCDIEGYEMPQLPEANPANDYGHYKGSAANHGYVFENVVAALSGGEHIATNALEGLKVVDIIERMYAAGERPLKPGVQAARRKAAVGRSLADMLPSGSKAPKSAAGPDEANPDQAAPAVG